MKLKLENDEIENITRNSYIFLFSGGGGRGKGFIERGVLIENFKLKIKVEEVSRDGGLNKR